MFVYWLAESVKKKTYREGVTRDQGPETWDPYVGPMTRDPICGNRDSVECGAHTQEPLR